MDAIASVSTSPWRSSLRKLGSIQDRFIPSALHKTPARLVRQSNRVLSERHQSNSMFLVILTRRRIWRGEAKYQCINNDNTKRPILSAFFHGLESLSEDLPRICIVPCGIGFCIYDLAWVKRTGKASRNIEKFSMTRDSRVQYRFLDGIIKQNSGHTSRHFFSSSASKLRGHFNDQAIEMLYAWSYGRLRPMITIIENVIGRADAGLWKQEIKGLVWSLTDPGYKESAIKTSADIRETFGRAVKNRLLYSKDLILEYNEPVPVEASFARIVVNQRKKEFTIVVEPIAFNLFEVDDPGLVKLVNKNPSGPDIVFVLESEGKYYPVSVQSKIGDKGDYSVAKVIEAPVIKDKRIETMCSILAC
ncbi:hypothetical protein BCR41DRAFT_387011 [Lobosporangium transversale]|uniref:Uncharacterized protein n=1 Tax=Lobosporangium transversale TaxID=64571 RepID=A0A1Y2GKJ5_9FUNG|nr:hypothetical protein BCR41DRAFT_387011 [Lobosporangium transversale]ORZ13764.1 hypothetical protein BCR41DRAFT_387011 [Lobosporangium transversale]|eukprot:XP_021880548.1 hypothetical protein BCR41DRAFT_387011 [Lobosporangium transversale]